VALIPEMVRLLQGVAGVIAMSDPDDGAFADSAADCLEALLAHTDALQTVLQALGGGAGR
ncbi:hypothetical protein DAH81_24465, partial [Sphingomonas koreensis]